MLKPLGPLVLSVVLLLIPVIVGKLDTTLTLLFFITALSIVFQLYLVNKSIGRVAIRSRRSLEVVTGA